MTSYRTEGSAGVSALEGGPRRLKAQREVRLYLGEPSSTSTGAYLVPAVRTITMLSPEYLQNPVEVTDGDARVALLRSHGM